MADVRRSFLPVLTALLLAWTAAAADPARISALIEQGKLDEALSVTEQELAANAGDVTLRFLKGLIMTRMNRLDEAADVFQALTDDHPELPEPYNNLAVVYAAKGDFERARQSLQKAINTHPSYATAHENMGDIYAKMASQAYNQALELNEDNPTAKAKLSLINNLFSLPAPAAPTQVAAAPATEPQQQREPDPQPDPQPEPQPQPEPEPAPAAEPEPAVVEAQAAPAAPQPAPAESAPPAAAPAAADPAAAIAEVRRAVDLWATAWSSRDFTAYARMYAADFTPPGGGSRKAWERSRQQRITRPAFIKVEVTDLEVTMLGGEHARAAFVQNYQSDTFSDSVKKTLLLKKSGDQWLITQEGSQ
jgi:tetratricopeptide (TPR) repeat protein